jgi:hypothetical protein
MDDCERDFLSTVDNEDRAALTRILEALLDQPQ